jgi:tetratricopeptide (TPR) repeat protein
MRLRIVLFLFVAALQSARAENRSVAREAFREGNRHYDLGRYSEALEAFMRAYWNFEEPAILFNIAQCHRQLGNKTDAVKFYRTFLRKVSDAPNADEVRRLIATLEASLTEERKTAAQPPQGTLEAHEARPSPAPLAAAPERPALVKKQLDRPVEKRPLWRRWWVWTIAGAGAAAVVGIGLGVGLSHAHSEPTFMAVTIP